MKTISISDTDTENLLARLANRHSVGAKYLTYPAPDLAQLEAAARVASRAPDHAMLRPFRFVLIGEEQRPRLAELLPPMQRSVARMPRQSSGPGNVPLMVLPCLQW